MAIPLTAEQRVRLRNLLTPEAENDALEWTHIPFPPRGVLALLDALDAREAQTAEALKHFAFALNGWACHAKSAAEQNEIHRLWTEHRKLSNQWSPKEPR